MATALGGWTDVRGVACAHRERADQAVAAGDLLLTIPNVSEGRDPGAIAAIGDAFGSAGARLLDVHSDADHHRTVYTLAGAADDVVGALVAGARASCEHIDLRDERGSHPHVGALDVAPIVFIDRARRSSRSTSSSRRRLRSTTRGRSPR